MTENRDEQFKFQIPILTSAIPVTQIWEPPHVSKSHRVAESRKEEVESPGPVSSLFILVFSICDTARIQIIDQAPLEIRPNRRVLKTRTLKNNTKK